MKTKQKVVILALAALITGTSHAAITGKSSGFMDKRQLAEWRAETASKSAKTKQEDTAFFTGKPYLALTDTYAFKFRSYDPSSARWTSEDPSGFPDGANASQYAPCPVNEFDFAGLWKIKLINPGSQGDDKTGQDVGLLVTSNYTFQYAFDATSSSAGYQIGGFSISIVTRFNTQTGMLLDPHVGAGQKYASLGLTSNGYLIGSVPAGSANTVNTGSGGIAMEGVGVDGTSRIGSITVQVNAAYKGVVTWSGAIGGFGYTPASGDDKLVFTHTFNFEAVEE